MSAQLSSAGALRRRVFCACARTASGGSTRRAAAPGRCCCRVGAALSRSVACTAPPRLPSPARPARRNEFDAAISETEGAYMKILESSQTLLSVLKRESTLLTKKKTGV